MASGSGEKSEQEAPNSEIEDGATESLVETVECPNCGRRFVGDYCPGCGQRADQSVSFWKVLGGFFREFSDLERGFWPTLVALTIRPGHMLREYLRGAREQFVGPGRYLLATGLIGYGLRLIQDWLFPNSLGESDGSESFRFEEPKIEKASGASDEYKLEAGVNVGENADIILAIAAVLAGAYIWRLFQDKIESFGEGVALSFYAGGGAQLIGPILAILFDIGLYLLGVRHRFTGTTMQEMAPGDVALVVSFGLVVVLLVLGYYGVCFGLCFSGWWDGIKASVVYAWSFLEFAGVLVAAGAGYTLFKLQMSPSEYFPESVEASRRFEAYEGILTVIAVTLLPALIHLGIELYYRWR